MSGYSDGKITVTASGGTPFLGGTYLYGKSTTDYQSSNVLTDFASGEKTIYVKDANDCEFQFKINVPEGRQITVNSTTPAAPTCNGGANGSCILIIGNLEGELSVSGLPSDCTTDVSGNTIAISGLEARTYTCRVIETHNGKTNFIETVFTIPQKSAINIETTVTPVFDKGSATGKIEVSVSGGNEGEYTVRLSDEANTYTETSPCIFSDLSGEFANGGKLYTLSVFDSKGCSKEIEIRMPEPEKTLQLQSIVTPVFCNGSNDAAINISATGGWGDYEYSTDNENWNTTTTFADLQPDIYHFYVKDKYGGMATTSITITNPDPLDIAVESKTDALCYNSPTGTIRFLVSGGTPPYRLIPVLENVDITVEDKNENTYLIVNGLLAGEYTFTLVDSHDCSLQANKATIGQPSKLTVSTSNLTHPTCGLENGTLTVAASGGTAPYTYKLILIGETNIEKQTLSSSEAVEFENIAGSINEYYIVVTDDNGCTAQSDKVSFSLYESPEITSTIKEPVVCFGESNGKITAIIKKGTADIQKFILTNDADNTEIENTTGVFANLTAGNYTLYAYDTNGCRSNAWIGYVEQPEELRIEVSAIAPAISKGAYDGKIQFRVVGGNTGNVDVYLKDNENATIAEMQVIRGYANELSVKTGTYTLEAIDSKDCKFTTEILQVDEPADSLRLIIREVQDALCKSQTGKITVEGQGGWGDYRYKRSTSGQYSELNRFENLYSGTYLITVEDKMGATASQSVTVYEPQDSLKAKIVDIQIPTCAANGTLSIALSGGTQPYKLFSDAGNDIIYVVEQETIQWESVASGTLLLHLTDANGCKFELETLVSDTALLRITGFKIIPPDVPQGVNGSIRTKISGGTSPFTYTWKKIGYAVSFPDNPQISNLSSGYYELKVTDGNDCSATESIYLPDPSDEIISVVETGDETTLGSANGYAILYSEMRLTNIRVINPKNNYTDYPATTNNANFRISNDSIYLNNLEGGKWFVIGTNAAEQNAIAEFEIKPYVAFHFGKIDVIPVSSPNGSDGSINVEVQGGAGENVFVWTDEQGNILSSSDDKYSSRLGNLPAGRYTLTVTDRYNNTISKEIVVPAPERALQLITSEQKNQTCSGSVNAYAILSAIGGWGDYRYAHHRQPENNNLEYSNTEVYSELETGEHYFFVVDKYGTIAELNITVTEPDMLRASVANIENVQCKDDVNGQIIFDILGGNPPYYFKESRSAIWQKGNTTALLPAGEYRYEFTDSLQCVCPDILTVIVSEPDSLLFRNIDVTHTTCAKDNGQILVSLKGGNRPYSYQWIDIENNIIGTDSLITNLKQGALYRLHVTDKNGCTQYMEQLIQASKPPRITKVETSDVLCWNGFTGAAKITEIEAGEPYAPYSFVWSNGATGDLAENFPAGRHSVTITDENDCATTYYFDIAQPDSLYLLITDYKEPHCFGYSDGYIHTQTIGGVGDYTYLWSNGATTPNNDNIPKGNYWVRVTDKNGCEFEKQFTLNEPPYRSIDLGEDIMMCPGNTHVIDGGNYVSHRWFTDKGDISRERYLSVTREDRYYLEAKTSDGCSAWGDIGISIGSNALKADMLLASVAAMGDTLVVFELSNLPLDNLKWEYDTAVFERITVEDEHYNLPYVLHLRCLQTGVYNIGLAAYSGGCYAPVVKQIEIVEAGKPDEDDWWVSRKPLIQSLKQYPNPTNGMFTVELELREPSEARFVFFDIASGICMDQRTETGSDYYIVSYNLTHLQTGVYALIVTAGNERKQLKIIIE